MGGTHVRDVDGRTGGLVNWCRSLPKRVDTAGRLPAYALLRKDLGWASRSDGEDQDGDAGGSAKREARRPSRAGGACAQGFRGGVGGGEGVTVNAKRRRDAALSGWAAGACAKYQSGGPYATTTLFEGKGRDGGTRPRGICLFGYGCAWSRRKAPACVLGALCGARLVG